MADEVPIPSREDREFWNAAIFEWYRTGQIDPLIDGLRSGRQIPENAKEWLAQIMTGVAQPDPELNEKTWRPIRNKAIRQRFPIHKKQAEAMKANRKRGDLHLVESAEYIAWSELAEMYGLSVSSIESILKKG